MSKACIQIPEDKKIDIVDHINAFVYNTKLQTHANLLVLLGKLNAVGQVEHKVRYIAARLHNILASAGYSTTSENWESASVHTILNNSRLNELTAAA